MRRECVRTGHTVGDMNDLPQQADVVFVGAGHNALVAAAYLLGAGRSVVLLEQMAKPEGWVQTAELGAPGFRHDLYSSLHPAFVGGPAWAELGPDLKHHGLEYVTAPLATASSLPDGRTAIAPVDPEAFAIELERLGETGGWNALFAAASPHLQAMLRLLGAGLDRPEPQATLAGLLRTGRDGALPFGQRLAGSAAAVVQHYFTSEALRMLAAPWPLHLGAGPDDAGSALWVVFSLAALAAGNPTPVGGSGRLAEPLVGLVTERGGDVVCDVDVDEILVRNGRATGVRTTSGADRRGRRGGDRIGDARPALWAAVARDAWHPVRRADPGRPGSASPRRLPDQPRAFRATAVPRPAARRRRGAPPRPRV